MAKRMEKIHNRTSQSGNVFLMILIGIVLFAALMFTFTRGIRQGTESMGGREAELAASDIVTYSQKVQRGVERILGNNISESDLSFVNTVDTNYNNPACSNEKCQVFNPAGGAVAWKNPPQDANSGQPYFFGANRVGSADGTTKDVGTSARDLVMILPVKAEVCEAINGMTNKQTTWAVTVAANLTTRFTGNYNTPVGTTIARGNELIQPTTGCFCAGAGPGCAAGDLRYFYNVLFVR